MSPKKIAVIGTGISGLTAAHLLSRQHELTVYEANDYIGGHTHTVTVGDDEDALQVDTGFIVCNDRNYPNFLKFMDRLGVQLQETEMSFSVRNDDLQLEFNGHNLNTLFAQRSNLLSPRFIGLVREILRFNKLAKSALETRLDSDQTLIEFVNSHSFSATFLHNYLLPMVAAIWSCSLDQAGDFPLSFFLMFFNHHGLLDIRNRPQWYVLKGGSHTYIEPMTRSFAESIRLNAPVTRVLREPDQVLVESNGKSENFEEVIFACHSDQAMKLLADASATEREILGAIGYQANDVILHTDATLMPKRKLAWASWNFIAGTSESGDPALVSYCMNILQGLPEKTPLLVSLNARDRIDASKILGEFEYHHPVYTREAMTAQQRRAEICGHNRSHFCGAYWYNGFHEDGVRSALDVAERFGESL